MTASQRCPTCNARLDAVGTVQMGGLVFCGVCRRVVGADKAMGDPRRTRPL